MYVVSSVVPPVPSFDPERPLPAVEPVVEVPVYHDEFRGFFGKNRPPKKISPFN